MTTAPTPPALAIADLLEYLDEGGLQFDGQPLPDAAAAELIRLQAELECLRKELQARKPLPPDALADKCEAWLQAGGAANIVDAFEAGYRAAEET